MSTPPTSLGPSLPLPLSLPQARDLSHCAWSLTGLEPWLRAQPRADAADGPWAWHSLGTAPAASSAVGRRCLNVRAVNPPLHVYSSPGRGRIRSGPWRGSPGRPPACTLGSDAMKWELRSQGTPVGREPLSCRWSAPISCFTASLAPSRVRVSSLGLGPGWGQQAGLAH